MTISEKSLRKVFQQIIGQYPKLAITFGLQILHKLLELWCQLHKQNDDTGFLCVM